MMLTLFGNGTRLLRGVALAGFALGAASTAASALPVQWSVGSGGNGHWYELVSASHTWSRNEFWRRVTGGSSFASLAS